MKSVDTVEIDSEMKRMSKITMTITIRGVERKKSLINIMIIIIIIIIDQSIVFILVFTPQVFGFFE